MDSFEKNIKLISPRFFSLGFFAYIYRVLIKQANQMNKIVTLIGGLILAGVILSVSYYETSTTVEIKVNNKERVVTGSSDNIESRYLVYTDGEVFENTDDLFKMKFNSSDVQNQLKVDSTYTVEVVGWRIPILSMHRNIVNIK